jgi:hypothetical protein
MTWIISKDSILELALYRVVRFVVLLWHGIEASFISVK